MSTQCVAAYNSLSSPIFNNHPFSLYRTFFSNFYYSIFYSII